jgi:predicted amidohydrolase
MSKKMIAVVWSVNTQVTQAMNIDGRLDMLKRGTETAFMKACDVLIQAGGSTFSGDPSVLFVVPEYFFARPAAGDGHGLNELRHLEEAEKDKIVRELVLISKKFPDMLFVPGTVAWRKPFERSGAKLYHAKPGADFGKPKTVSRVDKALASLTGYADKLKLSYDRPLSGAMGNTPAYTTQQKINLLGPLFRLPDFMARNTAYVLLNAVVLCKYNKQGDFHEVLGEKNSTVYIPGKLDGRFQLTLKESDQKRKRNRMDFGIEVCLDHAFGTTANEIGHLGKVDVHIISSAQVANNEKNVAVRDGGYLVHASSNKDFTTVKKSGVWFESKPAHRMPVDNFEMSFWEMDLALDMA